MRKKKIEKYQCIYKKKSDKSIWHRRRIYVQVNKNLRMSKHKISTLKMTTQKKYILLWVSNHKSITPMGPSWAISSTLCCYLQALGADRWSLSAELHELDCICLPFEFPHPHIHQHLAHHSISRTKVTNAEYFLLPYLAVFTLRYSMIS